MKALIAAVLVLLAAAGGYASGYRHGWMTGLTADTIPRGVISMRQLGLLGKDRVAEVKYALELDVDSGLLRWDELSRSELKPVVNPASGIDVFPGFEKYVRTLATYRKANASPLPDSEFAKLYPVPSEEARQVIARVVAEHAR